MRYLNPFESYHFFDVRKFLGEKINWDLLRHVEDILTKYADNGYNINININFRYPEKVYTVYKVELSENNPQLNKSGWWDHFLGDIQYYLQNIKEPAECRLSYSIRIYKEDGDGVRFYLSSDQKDEIKDYINRKGFLNVRVVYDDIHISIHREFTVEPSDIKTD